MHANSANSGGSDGGGEDDEAFPALLQLCHDTVSLSAGGSFAVFPQAAAYRHRLERGTDPTPEEALENERRAEAEREEDALKLERSLRSQDPLDYVKAGATATSDTLDRMAAGIADLMALKDALVASKALPVTVLLPLTLACSKLLRTQESHKLAIEGLLTQVKHMSPPSLLEERDALLQKLDKAEEEIESLKYQEESRLLAAKIHKREMVSQKWVQLSVKLKAAKQRMDHRIVTTRLKARNSQLNRRLDNLVEGNRLRTKAGGAQKLIRENVGILVQPRSPSPGVSDDEADHTHRRASHGTAAGRPSTSPVMSSLQRNTGDSRSIQESVEVHRANTPRQASTALITEVDRTVMAGVSFQQLQRRPGTSPATASAVTGRAAAIASSPFSPLEDDSEFPPTVGADLSFVFSQRPVENIQSASRSQRPSVGTAESTVPEEAVAHHVPPDPGPAAEYLGPSPENMLFVNTRPVVSRGGPRRSRGARYKISSKTSSQLAETHGQEQPVRFVTDERREEGTGSTPEQPLPYEDSYVLDSAREMASPVLPTKCDSGNKTGTGPPSAPLVPTLNLQAVYTPTDDDTLGFSSTTDSKRQRQSTDGDSSSVVSTPTVSGAPPRLTGSNLAENASPEQRKDGEQPYRDDHRPSTAYEGGSLEGTGMSADGEGADWPPLFSPLEGTRGGEETGLGTAAGLSGTAGIRPGTAPAAPEGSLFVARFDEESVPRSEVMELKLRHSLQLRTVQRAFEERLQILTKFWQQKGVDMLDRKVCDIGVGIDPPPPGLRPPPTPAQIASRAKAAGASVTHQLCVADKGVIKTGSPPCSGNPPVLPGEPRTSEFLNSRGRPVPTWQLHAQSSRQGQSESPREFRILPGGYHAFVYPPRKELVSRADSRTELRSHGVVSHEKQKTVSPFKLSERHQSTSKRFTNRLSSCPIGVNSPRSQTAPAGATRGEQRQL